MSVYSESAIIDLNDLLQRAVEHGASDLHLKVGQPPILRRDGHLSALEDSAPLDSARLEEFLERVGAPDPKRLAGFRDSGELDTSYETAGLPRFRVNAFRQRGEISFAFRLIPGQVPGFNELGLPPGVERLADLHHGLVLVTGATGVGKTTTVASMIGHINRTRQQHIVTIEDPIEILHTDERSIVNQREVGLDTPSFAEALRRVLRQDPDVIVIGELRDSETAETALQAAESGHLVLSTMHTIDAAETVRRLVEFFPAIKQPQVRSILAGVLRGVVSQRLLPKVGGGRVAAVEVMLVNSRIEELIREDRAEEIPEAIADGQFFDMRTLSSALIDLVLSGDAGSETAALVAPNQHDFLLTLVRAEKERATEARGAAAEKPSSGAFGEPSRLRLAGPPGGQ
jgi:twitching motility protein PilT